LGGALRDRRTSHRSPVPKRARPTRRSRRVLRSRCKVEGALPIPEADRGAVILCLRLERISALVRPGVTRLFLMGPRQFTTRLDEPVLDQFADRVPSRREAILRSDN